MGSARPVSLLRRPPIRPPGWITVQLVCPDCTGLLATFRNALAADFTHRAVVRLRAHRLTCTKRRT